MSGQVIPMFTAPSPREREALDLTASYLKRAGTEAAIRRGGAQSLDVGKAALVGIRCATRCANRRRCANA